MRHHVALDVLSESTEAGDPPGMHHVEGHASRCGLLEGVSDGELADGGPVHAHHYTGGDIEITTRLVYDDNRTACVCQDLECHRAERGAYRPAVTAAPHHDGVGAARELDQSTGREVGHTLDGD